jgi:hypothetical protein
MFQPFKKPDDFVRFSNAKAIQKPDKIVRFSDHGLKTTI